MANIAIKDGEGQSKYLKASGAGTDLDPFIQSHRLTDGVNEVGVTANKELKSHDEDLKVLLTAAISQKSALDAAQATIHYFKKETVTGSANQLSAHLFTKGFWLKANKANPDPIYIGGAGVTSSTGIQLEAGETIFLQNENSNLYYTISGSGAGYVDVWGF